MRPRMHVVLTPTERKSYVNWSRAVLAIVGLVAVGAMALPAFQRAAAPSLPVVAVQDR